MSTTFHVPPRAYWRGMENRRSFVAVVDDEESVRRALLRLLRAANMDGRAAVSQRLQDAELEGMDVVRIWTATKDDRTRDTHRLMDGQEVVGLDTPFTLPDGKPIRWPQDDKCPAEETINCRCTIRYRLVPKTVPGGQAAF